MFKFRLTQEAPETITEKFNSTIAKELDHHRQQSIYYQAVIADATKRLNNHKAALDALENVTVAFIGNSLDVTLDDSTPRKSALQLDVPAFLGSGREAF